MSELKPSKKAIQAVHKVAKEAFRTDLWLRVDIDQKDDLEDFGNFQMEHRDGWEQTNQFICLWRERIVEIAQEEALRGKLKADLIGDPDWEAWYNQIFIPLKEEFWDEWEDVAGLYEKWQEIKSRKYPDRTKMASIGTAFEVHLKDCKKMAISGIRFAKGCCIGEWTGRKFLNSYIYKHKITEVREIWIDDFGKVFIWLENLKLDEVAIITNTCNLA